MSPRDFSSKKKKKTPKNAKSPGGKRSNDLNRGRKKREKKKGAYAWTHPFDAAPGE